MTGAAVGPASGWAAAIAAKGAKPPEQAPIDESEMTSPR